MGKYDPATYAKAVVAFFTGFLGAVATAGKGVDLDSLDLGQWMLAIGTALTAGAGVFATPNKGAPSPIDLATKQVQVAAESVAKAQKAAEDLARQAQQAQANVGVLTEAVTGQLATGVKQAGSLVDQILNEVTK